MVVVPSNIEAFPFAAVVLRLLLNILFCLSLYCYGHYAFIVVLYDDSSSIGVAPFCNEDAKIQYE